MSFYQKLTAFGEKYIPKHTLFKYGYNLSPMYRRTTARLIYVSEDLHTIKIKLPISWKNRNYVNTIFGGSMFSAVDPIPMVQLMHLIGDDYVVWDKSAEIRFRRPAKEDLFATFSFTRTELEDIKNQVQLNNEIEIIKTTLLTSQDEKITYCEVDKTIYVADKSFFKQKRKKSSLT